MSFILNIDTALPTASVTLAQHGKPLGAAFNASQKDHAAWLHTAIAELMQASQLEMSQLNAVAVSAGPGSYTGLRVGMAAAKGLCYALQIPLITLNTLEIMAIAACGQPAELLCPMIDARRMEVFTAVFDQEMNVVLKATNLVLEPSSFDNLLDAHSICFFGNGSQKFMDINIHPNAKFAAIEASAIHMVNLSHQCHLKQQFADLAYAEPFYGKDFYSPAHRIL